jgi:hypothetical protein
MVSRTLSVAEAALVPQLVRTLRISISFAMTHSSHGFAAFFSVRRILQRSPHRLEEITGEPDLGYLTMVWEVGDRPSEWRPTFWIHDHPLEARKAFYTT